MKKFLSSLLVACLCLFGSSVLAGTVSSGEKVTITIKGVPSSEQASINGEYVVSDNGLLYMPMLKSGIKASGSSSSTVARRIEAAYRSAKVYSNPRITIITIRDEIKIDSIGKRENQFITVSGEVKRDGPVQYRNGMTIYEAIATAGGVDTFGAMNRVVLARGGKETILNLKKKEGRSVRVRVGDTITVPQKNAFGR